MEMSIKQLESLLNQQKQIVIERLLGATYLYNPQSTESNSKSMDINKDKFTELGNSARFPSEVEILKKYNIK